MQTIGIRELKKRLCEVMRAVKGGAHVLVTNRGTVVAELMPPGGATADPNLPIGLALLAERGAARVGVPNDPSLYRALPRLKRKLASAAHLLDDERGER